MQEFILNRYKSHMDPMDKKKQKDVSKVDRVM
jgi:hypothetical protein